MPNCNSTSNIETMAAMKTLATSSSTLATSSSTGKMKIVEEVPNEDGRLVSHGGSQGSWLPQVHMGKW